MSQKLLFDEHAFKKLPEKKKNIFIYEWLSYLDKVLPTHNRNEIKKVQPQIIKQLESLFFLIPGPPIRSLIAKNIASLFELGDILSLFDTIEHCNNILKSKDESKMQIMGKLCSLNVLGCIYEKLGRIVGRSYEGTIQILIKCLKTNDVDIKVEILNAMEKIIKGINSAGILVYKDICKQLKPLIVDNSVDVRCTVTIVRTKLKKIYRNFKKYSMFFRF